MFSRWYFSLGKNTKWTNCILALLDLKSLLVLSGNNLEKICIMQFFYNYCSINPEVREQAKIQHVSAAFIISPGTHWHTSGISAIIWPVLGLDCPWDKSSNQYLILADFSFVNLHNCFLSLSKLWYSSYAAPVSSQFNDISWENYNLTICT